MDYHRGGAPYRSVSAPENRGDLENVGPTCGSATASDHLVGDTAKPRASLSTSSDAICRSTREMNMLDGCMGSFTLIAGLWNAS